MHPLTRYAQTHNVSLYRLAERVGVSPSTLTRLVHKQRRPSAALIARIAAATGGEIGVRALLEAHFSPTEAVICLTGKMSNNDIINSEFA
jgi:transcriptional regulator with XRE-family HTH domain